MKITARLPSRLRPLLLSALIAASPGFAQDDENPPPPSQAQFNELCLSPAETYDEATAAAIMTGIGAGLDLNLKIAGTPLFSYMVRKAGNPALIEAALKARADPNLRGRAGMSPFMIACLMKQPEFIKAFAEARIDWNLKDARGESALLLTLANPDPQVLPQALALKPPRDAAEMRGSDGESLLTRLVSGSPRCTPEVLQALKDLEVNFNQHDAHGLTVLQAAFTRDGGLSYDEGLIKTLLSLGSSVNAPNLRKEGALHYMLRFPMDGALFKALMAAEPDLELRDDNGDTVLLKLLTAMRAGGDAGRESELDLLIAARADLQAVNDDRLYPLAAATLSPCPGCVRALLKAGAKPQPPERGDSTPILLFAAAGGMPPDIVRALIEAGADVNQADSRGGITPLLALLIAGNEEAALLAIKAGADVNLADKQRRTPLMAMARQCPDPSLAAALIKAGAALEAKDKGGKTALDYLNSSPLNETAELKDGLARVRGLLTGEEQP